MYTYKLKKNINVGLPTLERTVKDQLQLLNQFSQDRQLHTRELEIDDAQNLRKTLECFGGLD